MLRCSPGHSSHFCICKCFPVSMHSMTLTLTKMRMLGLMFHSFNISIHRSIDCKTPMVLTFPEFVLWLQMIQQTLSLHESARQSETRNLNLSSEPPLPDGNCPKPLPAPTMWLVLSGDGVGHCGIRWVEMATAGTVALVIKNSCSVQALLVVK